MNTRCPAWCDRVLMSPSAKELILRVSGGRALTSVSAGPVLGLGGLWAEPGSGPCEM